MIPAVGQRVGPYEILGRLGSGGMGLVFSAWDSRLQRDVAIKLLRDEFSARDMRERFLQEARAASGLNHPNICTIFDIGEQAGDPYLVMELLKGETLRSRIFSGPMSPEEILQIGTEIADALAAAHARGVIHRDIKPANIFLVAKPNHRWQAKVLDFGLAKIDLGDGMDARFHITGAGATVGTVSYMSPEQARGEMLDARSDLFALGIVLYEMATGQVPFHGATSALVFVQLLSHPPEPVRELNPSVPKELERIIVKLLSKDRSARFQSALEVLEALHQVILKKPAPGKSSILSLPAWARGGGSPLSPRPLSTSTAAPKAGPPSPGGKAGPPSPPPSPMLRAGESAVAPGAGARSVEGNAMIRPVRRVVTESLAPPSDPRTAAPVPPARSVQEVPPVPMPVQAAAAESAAAAAPAHVTPPVPDPELARSLLPKLPAKPMPKPPTPFSELPPVTLTYLAETDGDKPPSTLLTGGRARWLVGGGVLLTAVVAYAAVRWMGQKAVPAPVKPPTLVLASVANLTGNNLLDGVVLEALRLDLMQSPRLGVPSEGAVAAAMHIAKLTGSQPQSNPEAQTISASLGGTSFLFGDLRNDGGNYVLSVTVYDSVTGAHIAHAAQTAASLEQVPDAVDRVANEVRLGLGEKADAIAKSSLPLAQEATSNLEALEAYIAGNAADAEGRPLDAIPSLQHALALEPKFTQAAMRLAQLYRAQHAELAAADAAKQARDAASRASQRTRLLAQASYEIEATEDYPRALALLDEATAAYPRDLTVQAYRVFVLRVMGKFDEAVDAAQDVLNVSPYDFGTTEQSELAMLASNHSPGAQYLESETVRSGQQHPDLPLMIKFLNDPPGSDFAASLVAMPDGARESAYRADILDASGRLRAGLDGWLAFVQGTKRNTALSSAASYGLGRAALNRALMGGAANCGKATELAHLAEAGQMGQEARFSVGMAEGLCGDSDGVRRAMANLTANYPQSFPAKSYYLADLQAIAYLDNGDTMRALGSLQTARLNDRLSLTPYLRGRAHAAAKQWKEAIADFESIRLQRGPTTLVCALAYPMAQLELARAYAGSGDGGNSAAAYRAFLAMWHGADPGDPLLAEAQAHVR